MNTNYIIIGDSITYGIGEFESGGWASMFKSYIVNKDDSKSCNNYVHIAGFPGATSSDILDKIDSILQAFLHNEFTNTVILSIGVNDTQVFNGKTKSTIEEYKSNMQKIITHVTDKECNLVILGLTRIESADKFLWKPNKYYDNNIISEYDRDLKLILDYETELKELCQNNKVKYIPMQDTLENDDFIDGLHPNHKGHKKIFECVVENVKLLWYNMPTI